MKIIFLDIDGVLNSKKFEDKIKWRKYPWRFRLLDQEAILNLKDIVFETGAYIVLSSSWRYHEDESHAVGRQLAPYNLGIIDMTPTGGVYVDNVKEWRRGAEINAWLKEHPDVTNYVILDDDNDMLPEQMDHLVQTSWERGLEQEHIDKAIQILNS